MKTKTMNTNQPLSDLRGWQDAEPDPMQELANAEGGGWADGVDHTKKNVRDWHPKCKTCGHWHDGFCFGPLDANHTSDSGYMPTASDFYCADHPDLTTED